MLSQKTRSCTVVVPRPGKKPLKISIQLLPLILGASIVIASPLAWLGTTLYAMHRSNSELSESTEEVLEELENLDAEVKQLKERAGINEGKPQNLTLRPQGGKGGVSTPIDAKTRLQLVREQLPKLAKQLKREVKPALEKMLQDENARFVSIPQGIPVKGFPDISSEFGPRPGVFGGAREMHNGIDLLGAHGTPIYATANGTVIEAGYLGGFGNAVEIQHGYGYKTLYAHMTKLAVPANVTVKRGQLIGFMGSTGRSSGTHLHYTVFKDGKEVDPKPYMLSRGGVITNAQRPRLAF
ncbi:MAG: M23 family metallopeptidase [Thermosynechococcaceae cyanobacterium]